MKDVPRPFPTVKQSLISLIDTMTENQIIYTYEFLSLIFGKAGAEA